MTSTSTIEKAEECRRRAYANRSQALRMIYNAGLGHAGGDLSSMDILTTLYGDVLRVDPSYPNDPNRDRFFMSKGHCTGALYATLAEVGFFPQDELASYMRPLSRLNGHPDCKTTPGVETNTGPLGHGLPVAVGTALAAKLQGATWRTFVLTGDGELQEGSNWEAAMAAAHYELDNLTLVIDRNCLQQGDRTETTNRLEPLADKWRAFGWSVQEVDGHDYDGLLKRFFAVPFESGKPSCIIAHTHKGEGVSFMRGQVGWHHRVPTEAELSVALEELKQSSS